MRLTHISHDGSGRAVLEAEVTAGTDVRVDGVSEQCLALFGAASMIFHMFQILFVEVVECREHRIR